MSLSTARIISPRASVQPEEPILTKTRLLENCTKVMVVVLLVALMGFLLLSPGWALTDELSSDDESSDGTGIQVASWALTVPYTIGKSAFAIGGAVVGGLGFVFSGGNSDIAKTVWTKSIYGTYLIRPAHLRGEDPVYLLGKADVSSPQVAPLPAQPTPEPAEPVQK